MPKRLIILALSALAGCGGAAASTNGTEEQEEDERVVELTDDPERARVFQAPLDIFVRPLDSGLADLAAGAPVEEAFADVDLLEPESFASIEVGDGERLEIGELDLTITTVKDRGPPDSERWQQSTLEVSGVRAGGVFRLSALHSELRQLASAPEEMPEVPPTWSELRDAYVEGFAGPSCRFLPRLRDADLRGAYPDELADAMRESMPDQGRIDRTCGDLWDRSPPWRKLEVRRVAIHRVDSDRKVVARYEATLRVTDGALSFGAVREES
jgi:hypothetical protein